MFKNLSTLEIIGNVLTLIGMSLLFASSFCKRKRTVIITQTGNHVVTSIAEVLMHQYSGFTQDFVNILRNIVVLTHKNNKFWSSFFIILGLLLGVMFNYFFNSNSLWGYLPVIASLQYSIVILLEKSNVVLIKLSMIFSCILWSLYSFQFKNYVMFVANIIIAISCVITILLEKKKNSNNFSDV